MNLFSHIIVDRINELVSSLNEDLKEKAKYRIVGASTVEDITVVQVKNVHDEYLYNALDYEGKTPADFNSCWRCLSLLAEDFKIKQYEKK